jgi:hypothetical protein
MLFVVVGLVAFMHAWLLDNNFFKCLVHADMLYFFLFFLIFYFLQPVEKII